MSRKLIIPGTNFLNKSGDVTNINLKDPTHSSASLPKDGQKVLAIASDGLVTSGIYLKFKDSNRGDIIRLRNWNLWGNTSYNWEEAAEDDLQDFWEDDGILLGPEDLFSSSIEWWCDFPLDDDVAKNRFKKILDANELPFKNVVDYVWGSTYPEKINSVGFEEFFVRK